MALGTGTISMGGVTTGQSINLELGRSATASSNLNESSLRTLAGISSGTISLNDFKGKSAYTAYGHRPSTYSGTATNPAYAYDGGTTTSVLNSGNAATMSSATNAEVAITYSGFPDSTSRTGTLYVAIVVTFADIGSLSATVNGTIYIDYSTDSGTNWATIGILAYPISQKNYTATTTASQALTAAPSSIWVRARVKGSTAGSIPLGTDRTVQADLTLYDIVFVG